MAFPQDQMQVKYRNCISRNGYPLDELKSGLQKYCRRNELDKALWCAVELHLFGEYTSPDVKEIRLAKACYTNYVHRLQVIFLEDVGPVGHKYWGEVDGCIKALRGKQPLAARSSAIRCVQLLCELPHTRYLSLCASVLRSPDRELSKLHANGQLRFPQIAKLYGQLDDSKVPKAFESTLDECEEIKWSANQLEVCLRSKSVLAFYWAYQLMHREDKTTGRYYKTHQPLFLLLWLLEGHCKRDRTDLLPLVSLAHDWAKELKIKERTLCATYIISLLLDGSHLHTPNKRTESLDYMNLFEGAARLELDHYCIDMHTARGRKEGKNRVVFAQEGSKIVNEIPLCAKELSYSELCDWYLECKKKQEGQ
jgi:hypothetical protein